MLIENNQEGLVNYLKASNIKSKVKHPLFLAIYFSNVLKMYVKDIEKLFDSGSNSEIILSIEDEEAQTQLKKLY